MTSIVRAPAPLSVALCCEVTMSDQTPPVDEMQYERLAHEALRGVRRLLTSRADLRQLFEEIWHADSTPASSEVTPTNCIRRICRDIGWTWSSPWIFLDPVAGEIPSSVGKHNEVSSAPRLLCELLYHSGIQPECRTQRGKCKRTRPTGTAHGHFSGEPL